MSAWFWIITIAFIAVSAVMVLIILVQRPQGGGLAGAFGGTGGAGTETVFGGRVGDALTYATITAFVVYVGLAITLNLLDDTAPAAPPPAAAAATAPPATTRPSTDGATTTTTDSGGVKLRIDPPEDSPSGDQPADDADQPGGEG